MKKIFLLVRLLVSSVLFAQKDYKVVFDLTSRDTLDHKTVIRWLNEISKEEPNSQLEVVMYGKGVWMVAQGSAVSNDIVSLAAKKNISFRVCEVAMKNNGLDKTQLLPGVATVPDGIYEIISKQRQGWGYIKASK